MGRGRVVSAKDYGPDIDIQPGKVGEFVADSYVADATGRTYHIAGGGALIVRRLWEEATVIKV